MTLQTGKIPENDGQRRGTNNNIEAQDWQKKYLVDVHSYFIIQLNVCMQIVGSSRRRAAQHYGRTDCVNCYAGARLQQLCRK